MKTLRILLFFTANPIPRYNQNQRLSIKPKSIKRIGFFQGMAILFLVLTLVGFARTFFLRP